MDQQSQNPESFDRNSFLFTRLVLTFQAAAMQQMGKLPDPFEGKINRDLEQATISIDTLEMLHKKCKGNLHDDEEKLLSHIISELKLNYVDEVNRPQSQTASAPPAVDAESAETENPAEQRAAT